MSKTIRKYAYICAGTLALVFGVVGIFLPILPTTPFLLLASFCYLRSSKKLHQWLITRKTIGPYIDNYLTHRAILKRTKIVSLIFLWLSLTISMILIDLWFVRGILVLVGIGVSIHLLTLNTLAKDDSLSQNEKKSK